VPSDVIVSNVTFSFQELGPRLGQQWSFIDIEEGKVRVHGEPLARIDKRGARVALTPIGPREAVRWLAWAIQSICPDAEASDEEAEPARIGEEPMTAEALEKVAKDIVAARLDAIAKEAAPDGGAHEAVALVTYLVDRGLLELAGPAASVARAVMPLLQDVDGEIGSRLEDALLDLDEVDELFADADELAKVVRNNAHIFDR
jgi:hypothetical protein